MIINLYLCLDYIFSFYFYFQPQKKFKISVSKCNEIEQALATVTTRWSLANPYLWWNSVWNLLHWHFWIWLAACLNDLVYSNTNSRQPCYISLLSLKSAGIFQQHWPWVLCVYFTWCRIYVNQDENFCYAPFVSSLNKYLWYLGPNHLRNWRQLSVKHDVRQRFFI